MPNEPHEDEHLLEAIEVCRPASGDLFDPGLECLPSALARRPDLQERYEQVQRLDAVLGSAFQDVPIPEGLERRLLDRLGVQDAAEPAKIAAETAIASAPADRSSRVSRRWLLAAAGTLTTAAALLIAAWVQIAHRPPLTESLVLDDAIGLFNNESPGPGTLLRESVAPKDFPLSGAVLQMPGIRWRVAGEFLDTRGVAYDLPTMDGIRATLYVARTTVAGLPTAPPMFPRQTTAGCAVSAWQEGETLYVLVVQGDRGAYQRLLRLPQGPLT